MTGPQPLPSPFGGLEQTLVDARREIAQSVPLWPDDKLPTRRHLRRDCARMSAAGDTKTAAHPLCNSLWDIEVCPCGGFRILYDGVPHGRWEFRNKALNDPTWFTRMTRTDGTPS